MVGKYSVIVLGVGYFILKNCVVFGEFCGLGEEWERKVGVLTILGFFWYEYFWYNYLDVGFKGVYEEEFFVIIIIIIVVYGR